MPRRFSVFLISALLFLGALAVPVIMTERSDRIDQVSQPLMALPSTTPDTPDAIFDPTPTLATTATPTPTKLPGAKPPRVTVTPTPDMEAIPPQLPPVVEAPIQLRIPDLGVEAVVEWVGVDTEGRMDVPSDYENVAWYQHGPRPGMPGNAVIAGHLDSTTGPAVFFRLDDLQPGDEIFVTTHSGAELRFVVVGKEAFVTSDAPLERIFGSGFTPRLNLVTCEGIFSQSSHQYDQRLVIFTVLADSSTNDETIPEST